MCPEYCFVLEDNTGKVRGYAVACLNIVEFNKKMSVAWIPSMTEKYPKPEKDDGLTPAEVFTTF